ncbi:MAG: hypothetical protein P1P89_08815 [Desulfobacterales bacterium]|nr:hypothetical protein [Desulfobacterales bacterium]
MASPEDIRNEIATSFTAAVPETLPPTATVPLSHCTDYRLQTRNEPLPNEFRPDPVMFRLKKMHEREPATP